MKKPAQQIGLGSTIAIGLASMLGAGVFVVFRDAFRFAGGGLFLALLLAALVAVLNSASIYQLAKQIDRPGGTYTYARVYKNDNWSFIAGFVFVFGKIGSIAAIALVLGEYIWPAQKLAVAVIAILTMALINVLGIQRTAGVARVLATVTTLFLLTAIFTTLVVHDFSNPAALNIPVLPGGWGILTAASVLFFAFAGYARVATLGNEVSDSKRNIPRAIVISLSAVLVIYLALSFMFVNVLGAEKLVTSTAPFVTLFSEIGITNAGPVTVVVASVASLGSILALLAGVSRTAAEMASDRELPKRFEARNRFGSPWLAELIISIGAITLAAIGDLSWVIGFSSFSVLLYYAIAHLSAFAMPAGQRLQPRIVQIIGIALCVALALAVPGPAVLISTAIIAAALVIRALARKVARRPRTRLN